MPYCKENEQRQGHEEEPQFESVFLKVCVPVDVVEQANPAPPDLLFRDLHFLEKKLGLSTC